MPTTTIRINDEAIRAARPVLRRLGITPRAAIDAFLAQVASRKAIPFHLSIPDTEYARAEYGLSAAQIQAAGRRMRRAALAAKAVGKLRPVEGLNSLRE